MLLYFLIFLIFLSSVLFFAFVFIIGNWSIVYLWDIFFVMFLYFSSYFPFSWILLFVGAQEFWAMGLIFFSYLRDIDAEWTLEHYLYHGLGDGAT